MLTTIITTKINGFEFNAPMGSIFNRQMNALVRPQPGQWTSKIKLHIQGIVILKPETAYKAEDKTK